MCVILVCKDKKPTKDILKKCEQANKDGIGIAWIENNISHFEKGICFNRLIELVKSKPLPFVIHFRITSTGITSEPLCHPFITNELVDIPSLEGKNCNLLFHNGTKFQWYDGLFELAMAYKFKVNSLDNWNDTRYMAIASHFIGNGILEHFKEKLVYMNSKGDITIFNKQGFKDIDGILYSNDYWNYTNYFSGQTQTVNLTNKVKTKPNIYDFNEAYNWRNRYYD